MIFMKTSIFSMIIQILREDWTIFLKIRTIFYILDKFYVISMIFKANHNQIFNIWCIVALLFRSWFRLVFISIMYSDHFYSISSKFRHTSIIITFNVIWNNFYDFWKPFLNKNFNDSNHITVKFLLQVNEFYTISNNLRDIWISNTY